MPRQAENEPHAGTQRQRRTQRFGRAGRIRRAERVAHAERELKEAAPVRLYSYRRASGWPTIGRVDGSRVLRPSYEIDNLSEAAAYEGFESYFRYLTEELDELVTDDLGSLVPAPALHNPSKIVCVGLNYKDHVTEGGRAGPDRPLLFSKFANAVIASGEPIVRPEGTHALDLEVELGVVIGKQARRVKVSDAMSHVAGYVVVNDVSARDWQGIPAALHEGETGDGQWIRAKGSDTFLPMGPDFVTADELDPAAGLRLRSWLIRPDGKEQLMQDSTTAHMIHSIPELIEYISKAITLEPGDVIATGTPSGVGVFRDPPIFLEPGDRVRCEVEGIGSVDNPVIDWTEDPRDA